MNTTQNNEARWTFVNEALGVAVRHNLLNTDDQAEFRAAIADGNILECEGWASGVVYDLSNRCRSFTPDVLTNLIAMGKNAGSIPA